MLFLRPRALNVSVWVLISVAVPLGAQQTPVAPIASLPFLPPASTCQNLAAKDASLHDRLCYAFRTMTNPGMVLHAAFESSFAEWRHDEFHRSGTMPNIGHRAEYFYARQSAQKTGELLAGWLHHEAIEPLSAEATGFWKRSKAALWSVLAIRDEDGVRMAYGPIAGSLASGFVTTECCVVHEGIDAGARRAAVTYIGYFGTALWHEFRPEVKAYLRQKFHR